MEAWEGEGDLGEVFWSEVCLPLHEEALLRRRCVAVAHVWCGGWPCMGVVAGVAGVRCPGERFCCTVVSVERGEGGCCIALLIVLIVLQSGCDKGRAVKGWVVQNSPCCRPALACCYQEG